MENNHTTRGQSGACPLLHREQSNRGIFELLAPAGSPDIFYAVIAAGADAVYVGGSHFGARAYADNFSSEELLAAIDYAHLHGRRVYLTVNTLLKNREIQRELYAYLLPLYERGLDAVLVQDIGVFAFIRRMFPDLAVHASTQMTVASAEGAALLAGLKARRVVLARELTVREIRQIHDKSDIELEVFVHGALCYSYSGQCLLSSMLGARSANRGRCAQPCRLPYTVLDEKRRECLSDSYVLSLKDLCGIRDLDRLYEAGVYSLKIEGRMKQAAYAAGVTACYRRYIDRYEELLASGRREEYRVEEADWKALVNLGSRGGFTNAYYREHNDSGMVMYDKSGYERADAALEAQVLGEHETAPRRLRAKGRLLLREGRPSVYEVSCGECCVSVTGLNAVKAVKKPLLAEEVSARMGKTGDTFFVMEEIDIDMPEDVFVPNGALNALRRSALDKLAGALLQSHRRRRNMGRSDDAADRKEPAGAPEELTFHPAGEPPAVCGLREYINSQGDNMQTKLICLTKNRALLDVILAREEIAAIYLDAEAYPADFMQELGADVLRCKAAEKEVCLAMPLVFRPASAGRWRKNAKALQSLPLDGVLVRSLGELQFVRTELPGLAIIADYNLYACNDLAVQAFAELGAVRNTVPLELNQKEISHRDNAGSEMVVYGYYPLMTSAQCVCKNARACSHTPGVLYLKDRMGKQFAVKNYCADCYNVIYNSLPTVLFERMDDLKNAGIRSFRLDFTLESKAQAVRVLDVCRDFYSGGAGHIPKELKERYTGGHYRRGVE